MSNLTKDKSSFKYAEGVKHWWMQRLTAIALIPLVVWFSFFAANAVKGNVFEKSFYLLDSQISVVLFGLLLVVALYHSTLGVKVIIEDYVHNKASEIALTIFINLFGFFTAILLCFSLVKVFLNF
jgi:succinate dehydrogenase / fumarate reductase membrane anchor subunit